MTKDEIEAELTKRFDKAVYTGMTNPDYLRALAKTVIGFVAEEMATKPCTYEARELPTYLMPSALSRGSGVQGAWCQTHGWDCPRAMRAENK